MINGRNFFLVVAFVALATLPAWIVIVNHLG